MLNRTTTANSILITRQQLQLRLLSPNTNHTLRFHKKFHLSLFFSTLCVVIKMELLHCSRIYGGESKFYRETQILRKDNAFFYAYTDEEARHVAGIKTEEVEIFPIPVEAIYPPFEPNFSFAPDPLPPDCHIKRPDVISYDPNGVRGSRPSDKLLKELRIYEILKLNPHPNIAQYLGCIVEGDRITGLVFPRYRITLADRFEEARPLRPEIYLEGIDSGLRHLHTLGFIHNDINPWNIMLKDDDTPIIIDFDICECEGEKCSSDGTEGWSLEDMEFAVPANDYHGLMKIREALERGKIPDYDEELA